MVSGEHAVKTVLLALLLAFVAGAVLTPPDPFTQVLYVVPLFLVALPVAHFALKRVA
ncbi:twin-arginine translocase subunit TatC [Haladaptatus salinisoli]|uniref:twin-arginine translocase subunit TatC n=1 Tax=Haladaptatus salinisoli TaxID=2884876 RepID=UPI001D0BA6C1|nr:twin-arginine translocase subunit TatC [Haladaptatus salinisoli]